MVFTIPKTNVFFIPHLLKEDNIMTFFNFVCKAFQNHFEVNAYSGFRFSFIFCIFLGIKWHFLKVSAVTYLAKRKSFFEIGYRHKCAEICIKIFLKIECFPQFKECTFVIKIEETVIKKRNLNIMKYIFCTVFEIHF